MARRIPISTKKDTQYPGAGTPREEAKRTPLWGKTHLEAFTRDTGRW